MHLGAPPIPHFGDHESGEDDDREDGYGQELDAGRKHFDNLPGDHLKATLRLGLNECQDLPVVHNVIKRFGTAV